jgi:hypothetical protein
MTRTKLSLRALLQVVDQRVRLDWELVFTSRLLGL